MTKNSTPTPSETPRLPGMPGPSPDSLRPKKQIADALRLLQGTMSESLA
jgi:hypothetical protein